MEEEIKTTEETGAQETPTAEGEGEEKTRKGEKVKKGTVEKFVEKFTRNRNETSVKLEERPMRPG